ncbi:MAG: hypothetical protein KGR18_02975 [Acidobacteria bacterium]|nr:hypothetical protein [Acidobacteriota bacterium]
MSGIGFLLIVVVIFVVGSISVWLRNRQPTNPLASVDDFEREMQALGTPHVVADGQYEPQPRRRMNTVSIRPMEPAAADRGDATEPDDATAATHDEDDPDSLDDESR